MYAVSARRRAPEPGKHDIRLHCSVYPAPSFAPSTVRRVLPVPPSLRNFHARAAGASTHPCALSPPPCIAFSLRTSDGDTKFATAHHAALLQRNYRLARATVGSIDYIARRRTPRPLPAFRCTASSAPCTARKRTSRRPLSPTSTHRAITHTLPTRARDCR